MWLIPTRYISKLQTYIGYHLALPGVFLIPRGKLFRSEKPGHKKKSNNREHVSKWNTHVLDWSFLSCAGSLKTHGSQYRVFFSNLELIFIFV